MSDLNNLFKYSDLPIYGAASSQQSYQPAPRPQNRRLFDLKSQQQHYQQPQMRQDLKYSKTLGPPLRRTQKQLAKTTIQNQNMLEEIEYFRKLSNQQFYIKSLTIVTPLVLLGLLGIINKKVCFELILVGVSLLLVESNFIENKMLKQFNSTIPVLTYLALIYDILIQGNYTGQYYVTLANLPSLICAGIATANFLLFRNLEFVSHQNLQNVVINLTKRQTIVYFFKKYLERIKSMCRLWKHFVILNTFLLSLLSIGCFTCVNYELLTQTFLAFLPTIAIYFFIDIVVYTVEFFSRQISLFNLKQKFYQVHVGMSLLRLKSNNKNYQDNEKIHHRCLWELAREVKQNRDYLEIPVKVNYAINTYRDIFQIYALGQVKVLLSNLNDISREILKISKIINSTKTWKQDLFILPRQIFAKFQVDLLQLKALMEIDQRKLLFLIFVRLSADSPTKSQILQDLSNITEVLAKIGQGQNFSETGQLKIEGWVRQLQLLQNKMRNKSIGITLSRISKVDQNGWAHYQRKNVSSTGSY